MTTVKGTVKAGQRANIKLLHDASGTVQAQMFENDSVWGTDAGTDITGFTHFHRANGSIFVLPPSTDIYKVSKTNMLPVTLGSDPCDVTPPPPTVTLKHTVDIFSDGSISVDGNHIA